MASGQDIVRAPSPVEVKVSDGELIYQGNKKSRRWETYFFARNVLALQPTSNLNVTCLRLNNRNCLDAIKLVFTPVVVPRDGYQMYYLQTKYIGRKRSSGLCARGRTT